MYFAFIFFFSSFLKEQGLSREIDSLMLEPELSDGLWGVHVYAPLRQKVLYSLNEKKFFRPASNLKIVSTLLAFEHLGSSYLFHTSFFYSGYLENDVLHGDLIIQGHGDPSLAGHYLGSELKHSKLLSELIERIQACGIKTVQGNIRVVEGFFDDVAIQQSWEWEDVGQSFGTPVTDLSLHDGRIDISIETDRDGNPEIHYSPLATPDVQITAQLSEPNDDSELEAQRIWGTNHFKITGGMAPCSVEDLRLSAWSPVEQFGAVLIQEMQQMGLQVNGKLKIERDSDLNHARFLFNHYSHSLAELAKVLMKNSQNHYADSFLKTVAKRLTGEGSFEKGEELAGELIRTSMAFSSYSDNISGFSQIDGSGLSSHNYIQPLQIAGLLRYAVHQPYFKEWLATFPIMGLDGTLEERGSEDGVTKGRVWAKTGYIYRSRCLSGYIQTLEGEPIIFSMMVNNYGSPTRHINQVQDEICSKIIHLKANRKVKQALLDPSLEFLPGTSN